jgi:poly-gamma-glutamate synthesis protein (capsule biosynthesis protein)
MMNQLTALALFIALSLSGNSAPADLPDLDLQFFGDVFLPTHVLEKTGTTAQNAEIFRDVTSLLQSSRSNIVNFEGVASSAFFPEVLKRHTLKMPPWVGKTLGLAGIHAASLANNHALDFGWMGLFETKNSLENAGIKAFGAGINLDAATEPLFLPFGHRQSCLIALSRTLPSRFWATANRGGTAALSGELASEKVRACQKWGYFTAVIFHWGAEMERLPKPYQINLAKTLIDAGADLIIGHHPHILQPIEIYRGKPIFYSIGNFAFGSMVFNRPQEGMAIGVSQQASSDKITYRITPLNVQNSEVKFFPRPLKKGDKDPSIELLPKDQCTWQGHFGQWLCQFKGD